MAIDEILVFDGMVDIDTFTAAARSGETVGSCDCGGRLYGSVDSGRGLIWLTLRCRACRSERTSPGGRLLSRPRVQRRQPAWVREAARDLEARRFPEPDAA